MMTENDARYLSQGSMQKLLCLLGAKVYLEKIVREVDYEPAMAAVGYLSKAVDAIDKAYAIFIDGVEPSQIKRLQRFNYGHRLALVPECDPVIGKVPMIMDWEHVRTMVGVLNSEVCTLCDKDRVEVNNCPLRKAMYDMGAEPDASKAKINEWCEMSRGIL